MMNTMPITSPVGISAEAARACCSPRYSIVPAKPNTSEMPYSSRPDASDPSTKYFRPASADPSRSRSNAHRM